MYSQKNINQEKNNVARNIVENLLSKGTPVCLRPFLHISDELSREWSYCGIALISLNEGSSSFLFLFHYLQRRLACKKWYTMQQNLRQQREERNDAFGLLAISTIWNETAAPSSAYSIFFLLLLLTYQDVATKLVVCHLYINSDRTNRLPPRYCILWHCPLRFSPSRRYAAAIFLYFQSALFILKYYEQVFFPSCILTNFTSSYAIISLVTM